MSSAQQPQATPAPRRRRSRIFSVRRKVTPGAPPGTVSVDASAPKPRLRVIAYTDDQVEEAEPTTAADLKPWLQRAGVVWIDVSGLGDAALLTALADLIGMHRLVLEDVVHVHQRPKLEDYGDSLFAVARMPRCGDPTADTEQVSLFVRQGLLVSFQETVGDVFDPVRQRVRAAKGRIRAAGADYLAYAIVDALTDSYFPILERYGEHLEQLEERVTERPERAAVHEIHQLKRDLLLLRRVLWPTREMLSAMLREGTPVIAKDTRVYLRDCYDHAVQLMDILESDRETATSLMEFYLSTLSNQINEVMRVLTVIATIFIPLTFISGVYGMNFDYEVSPLNMPELHWWFGYPFALLLMALVGLALLAWFWRLGWLRRP